MASSQRLYDGRQSCFRSFVQNQGRAVAQGGFGIDLHQHRLGTIFLSQARCGFHLGGGAGHQDGVRLTAFSLRLEQSSLRESLAKPYDARAAQPITPIVLEPFEIERRAEAFERCST